MTLIAVAIMNFGHWCNLLWFIFYLFLYSLAIGSGELWSLTLALAEANATLLCCQIIALNKKCLSSYEPSAMCKPCCHVLPTDVTHVAVDSFLSQCRMTIDRWHVCNCQLLTLHDYHVAIVWRCHACYMLNWDYVWSVTATYEVYISNTRQIADAHNDTLKEISRLLISQTY